MPHCIQARRQEFPEGGGGLQRLAMQGAITARGLGYLVQNPAI
jgi:hypothetical protein